MFYFSLKWVNIRGNIIIYLGENKIYVQLVSWPKQKRAVLLLSRFVGNHWLESYEGRALAMHKTASDKRTWHMCQILLSVSSYIYIRLAMRGSITNNIENILWHPIVYDKIIYKF